MGTAKCIGRVGALAVALGVGIAVANTPGVAFAEPADAPSDRTALVMGTSGIPTPDDFWVESVKKQFIAPTHPRQDIEYVKVTTAEEVWPFTGLFRLLCLAAGPQDVCGPNGPAWPDEPLWKLSGLFDLTLNQSVQAGLADLETAMATNGNDDLVIFGYSQSASIANLEKRKLAEQYPAGTKAPDIDFVLFGDPNLPNGGLGTRFWGVYLPIIEWDFNGPAPTDTQFDTVEITRQYDFFADFPLYPINVIADLNAVLGAVYVHTYGFDVSLPPYPAKSPAYQDTHGDTDYYFFETEDLPLFGPLRTLGVPEPLIDVIEPFFRVIVELGYDRTIPPWEPTPARLIPMHEPATVASDLIDAVGEGITNAAALIGAPTPLSIPATATTDQEPAGEPVVSAPGTTVKRLGRDVGERVSQVLTAVGSELPQPSEATQDDRQASQREVDREQPAARDRINETIGAVKSVIGNGRTIVRSAGGDNGSTATTANPARKSQVRDAVTQAESDIEKVVTKVADSIKTALSGGQDDDNDGEREAQ